MKTMARNKSEIRTASSGLAVGEADLVSDKVALISGYTGQDGTFLTDYLLNQGYQVIGMVRRISTEPPRRIRGGFDFTKELELGNLILVEADLLSVDSLIKVIEQHRPDEVYNLAAQSHVGVSFKQPELTAETNYLGLINLITALENSGDDWKLYQASTSEMFGNRPLDTTLNEESTLNPVSPYAIAKTAAHHYCQMKRGQGKFISTGILFNHESEIRGGDFVTQKIARGVKEWRNSGKVLELGNLDSARDWGYAGDYIKAMHLILQQEYADDFVVGTGQTHTVREFVNEAFNHEIVWRGDDGYINDTLAVTVNPEFYRPNEVGFLRADASKIRARGWQPKVSFKELVRKMVDEA